MTADSSHERPPAIPDAILEDAAAWHARLREPQADPATAAARRTDFQRWLTADPRHQEAFEENERLWHALEAPVAQAMARESRTFPKDRQQRRLSKRQTLWPTLAAACLLAVIATTLLYQDYLIARLHSDHVTEVGQQLPLTLEDGTRLTLNTDSAIALDLEPNQRQVHLLRGEAWFDVAHDPTRPFLVKTPEGLIRVTGTSFGVRLAEDAALVSLTEGSVDLAPNDGDSAWESLAEGQQVRLAGSGISKPVEFDKTAVTAWLRGQVVFFDTPLSEVVSELNRYRSGHILVMNDDLESLKISGVFKTEDPEAALTAIASTLPVRVTRITDLIVLLR